MRYIESLIRITGPLAIIFVLAAAGCDRSESNKPAADPNAGAPKPQVSEQHKPTTQAIIPIAQMVDWCPEHAMPESICVQCNASLAAAFKAKGDWDEQHGLPKSQCFKCDPSLKEKFAVAYKEKYGKAPPAEGTEEKSKTP